MNHPVSRQQLVRQAIRQDWSAILGQTLDAAIEKAQVDAAVSDVLGKLWPASPPALLMKLVSQDSSFLLSASNPSSNLKKYLQVEICSVAAAHVPESLRSCEHAKGTGLRTLISQELANQAVWSDIQRRIDALFEKRGTDKLRTALPVFQGVLDALRQKVYEELELQVGKAVVSASAIHHLKVFTALLDRHGGLKTRAQQLLSVRDHHTASLPFVAKYVHRNAPPPEHTFSCAPVETAGKLDAKLITCFGEAQHVQNCIDGFRNGHGVLADHVPADSPIRPELEGQFERLPEFVEPVESSLVLDKRDAVRLSRERKSALIDGVVCVAALAAQVESLLCQVIHVQERVDADKLRSLRPASLIARAKKHVRLATETEAILAWLFSEDCLAVRDALAHGAFYANDWKRITDTTAIVERGLHDLFQDLVTAGIADTVLSSARWDRTWHLPVEPFERQRKHGLNLADQANSEGALEHYAKVLKKLVPDKANMGMAGFLLWAKEQAAERNSAQSDTNSFAAIVANLVVLESLFRAVLEIKGHTPITISKEGVACLKCTLHILTDTGDQLLSATTLEQTFGELHAVDEFKKSVEAVRDLRNHVMHGAWSAITPPYSRYSHLVGKLLFTLAIEVGENQLA